MRILSFAVLSVATALALLVIGPARAEQAQCGPAVKILEALGKDYGEAPVVTGLMEGNTMMITILANPAKGTWTALVIDTKGNACLTAAGKDYQQQAYKAPKTGAPL